MIMSGLFRQVNPCERLCPHTLQSSHSRISRIQIPIKTVCQFDCQVCQYEHQLHDHFFPGPDTEGTSLGPLMDPLATILYDAMRPRFIHLHSLQELCQLVDILVHEVILSFRLEGSQSIAGATLSLACTCSAKCVCANIQV